jgi:hypothetical protein
MARGNRDEVKPERRAAVAEALSDGRLAVLPGSHALPWGLPEVTNALLVSFLRNGAPAPLLRT